MLISTAGTRSSREAKTKGKNMDAYTALAEVEVEETELAEEETVDVGEDFDAWMNDMLSSPADYDY